MAKKKSKSSVTSIDFSKMINRQQMGTSLFFLRSNMYYIEDVTAESYSLTSTCTQQRRQQAAPAGACVPLLNTYFYRQSYRRKEISMATILMETPPFSSWWPMRPKTFGTALRKSCRMLCPSSSTCYNAQSS